MSRCRCLVVSTAPRSVTERQSRARSVPPERCWISDARVVLPEAVDDDPVELLVCGDECLRRLGLVHPREADLERGVVVLGQARRSHPRRDGLEDAADLVELEQGVARDEVADEPHARQEELGLEARHVGAVADARLEDADQGQGPHCLAERVPG